MKGVQICCFFLTACSVLQFGAGFRSGYCSPPAARCSSTICLRASDSNDLDAILTARFPTSVEDQVRQAAASLKRATADGKHRHSVRLLLPVIGATELDDWPGGARQMMEAADPLMQSVVNQQVGPGVQFQKVSLDESDGVYAMLSQAAEAKDDACTVLLPSSDTVPQLEKLEPQVGSTRNLILVNTQWKRQSDFGFFGRQGQVDYVEAFEPSFHCTNLMVEGDQIRVLRNYPGPWRVFLRQQAIDGGEVNWIEIGQKDFVETKPVGWNDDPANKRDGGKLFDYGMPGYDEIETMITSMEGYQPKSVAERAAAAFNFIKDTL
eukprot:CAMPEP_0194044572 /NCGR_PEP_ID=MMETSP0009_2-20130614/16015_1 /TAXON_ID=210454 /ORGANISM="Grammatophora oceanica, Strain CCMP 410" /LENGTH=321 /DNA_ID=CAMNT_0038689129 /DNA_START=150 /DNA_END=1115 /DNA_ORIENTATION=-